MNKKFSKKEKNEKTNEKKNEQKTSQTTRINSAWIYLAKLVLRWLNTHIQTFVRNYIIKT